MISIVIPAYNEQDNIENCLDSLCKQNTKRKFEVILVNNNSTDNTVEKASAFKNKLNLKIITEKKKGRGSARRTGFQKAQGDYILSTDADTLPPSDWIETLLNGFKNHTAAVTGPCRILDCGTLRNFLFNHYQPFMMRVYKVFFRHYWLSGFNFAIRRDIYQQISGFDAELNVMEDIDLSIQVAKIGRINFVKESCVIFSGRRFQNGLIKGLLEYLKPACKYYLYKSKKVYLSDPR